MIIVIADDITGAAELAGIGLRYDLRVVISDDVNVSSPPDLLVIYTNTRSMPEGAAVKVMQDLTERAAKLKPSLFYKKTDSVLRGHILAELQAQMKILNFERALLIPVNPALGRTIKNGRYYLHDEPIHQTSFSSDPEFPVQSSFVKEMLVREGMLLKVVARNESLLDNGVFVGEAASDNDLAEWASYSREKVLFAGGASFFAALLNKLYAPPGKKKDSYFRLSYPLLFVSGTTFQKNVERIKQFDAFVCYLPSAIISQPASQENALLDCANEVVSILQKNGKAFLAIGEQEHKEADPNALREKQSEVVKSVFNKIKTQELIVEGGSTAYSIIQKLGWKTFVPTEELQLGIVRMEVEDIANIHFTIKPGSYDWPPQWNFK